MQSRRCEASPAARACPRCARGGVRGAVDCPAGGLRQADVPLAASPAAVQSGFALFATDGYPLASCTAPTRLGAQAPTAFYTTPDGRRVRCGVDNCQDCGDLPWTCDVCSPGYTRSKEGYHVSGASRQQGMGGRAGQAAGVCLIAALFLLPPCGQCSKNYSVPKPTCRVRNCAVCARRSNDRCATCLPGFRPSFSGMFVSSRGGSGARRAVGRVQLGSPGWRSPSLPLTLRPYRLPCSAGRWAVVAGAAIWAARQLQQLGGHEYL